MTTCTSPLVLSSFAEIGPFCMLEFLGYTLRSCPGLTVARSPGSDVRVSGSSPDTQTLARLPEVLGLAVTRYTYLTDLE